MLQQKRLGMGHLWLLLLLGLTLESLRCDARAVNVSNTWTMPQEGLNVFYRFFRDRISWFEADAVCQFHHANLVTVDNSFQFDATRDLLRELDVNDIVWIGLMRPQNSDRFMWSNSRPLVTDTGYWAESLPLMDAPLCAVIDPIRDYRWHALRCGGPETASFLCEMPVPSWADACILKDMPNLTMQYMADTASIELIRNCQEEGLLRQTCKGKEDRERAIRELICPKERLEAQRINDITNSHFKSLQIINSIRTDNNENNDIDLLPLVPNYGGSSMAINIEVAPATQSPPAAQAINVQHVIDQFSLDELMQADDAMASYHIPDEIPQPVKKSSKKVVINDEYAKKLHSGQDQQQEQDKRKTAKAIKSQPMEDMMMGDQPALSDEEHEESSLLATHLQPAGISEDESDASNEILEHLPHKKKILLQDLRTMPTLTEQWHKLDAATATTTTTTTTTTAATTSGISVKHVAATTELPHSEKPTTTITRTTAAAASSEQTTIASTPTSANMDKTSVSSTPDIDGIVRYSTVAPAATTTLSHSTQSPATISHPMHPHQSPNIEESQLPHAHAMHPESADNSHFIPPMLLVKSHYVPPSKHGEHVEHVEHVEHTEHFEHGIPHATHNEGVVASVEPLHATTTAADVATTPTTTTTAKPMLKLQETQTNAKIIAGNKDEQFALKPLTSIAVAESTTSTHATTTTTAAAATTTTTVASTTTTMEAAQAITTESAERQQERQKKLAATVAETTIGPTTTTAAAPTTTGPTTTTTTTNKVATTEQPATTTATPTTTTTKAAPTTSSTTTTTAAITTTTKAGEATTTTTTIPTATHLATEAPAMTKPTTTAGNEMSTNATLKVVSSAPATTTITTTTTIVADTKTTTNGSNNNDFAAESETTTTTATAAAAEGATTRRNFLKEETEAPFKPNRRRSLTKPETVSYFKKILG